ncbi:MAG TPA: hypothetical protein VJU77_04535 [Chthoniobacterales bacterium]|nr:hypothetical protein [Chthoniobacterales bacterium]
MAKNESRKIAPSTLQEDRDAFAALKNIPDYGPANTDYTVAKIATLQTAPLQKRDFETQEQAEFLGVRDDATAGDWTLIAERLWNRTLYLKIRQGKCPPLGQSFVNFGCVL